MNAKLLKRIQQVRLPPCIRGMRMRDGCFAASERGRFLRGNSGRSPDLEREDILAAIEYAARQTDHVVSAAT